MFGNSFWRTTQVSQKMLLALHRNQSAYVDSKGDGWFLYETDHQ